MGQHPQLRALEAPLADLSARYFFDITLRELLVTRRAQARALGGRFGFVISGGEWVVDLDHGRVRGDALTSAVQDDDALDAVLTLSEDAFARAVRGELGAGTHCEERRQGALEALVLEANTKANGLVGGGDFYNRIPVGELGEPLARALMRAVDIVSVQAGELAAEIKEHPGHARFQDVIAHTTLLQDIRKVLVEGVVSIAQTLALLLAKKPPPPYDTADAALQLIDTSKLVTQLAGMAPFGVVAPMASVGLVPSEPIGVVTKSTGDRAQLPRGFEEILHAVHAARVEHLHHGNLADWVGSDHRNETGRGCPVAGRGPVVGPDGKFTLSKDAGLSELTHRFIDLTRKLLASA
jgi:hypothetical protein